MVRVPRFPLHLASGTGIRNGNEPVCIRFLKHGCTNRPFFHIVVTTKIRDQKKAPIEQLGTYDRSTNEHGEKLVSLNLERIVHWVAKGADVSVPVAELLGLAGFFPIHPISYMSAWRLRLIADEQRKKAEEERKKAEAEESAKQGFASVETN